MAKKLDTQVFKYFGLFILLWFMVGFPGGLVFTGYFSDPQDDMAAYPWTIAFFLGFVPASFIWLILYGVYFHRWEKLTLGRFLMLAVVVLLLYLPLVLLFK